MDSAIRQVDGKAWEDEIVALLGKRYPPGDFFEVPASDKGDLGMDGVATNGVVFQCYAAEEPLTSQDRIVKQKKKVYDDLRKLVKNKSEHRRVLGDIKIRRWMLITANLKSKEIQAYANERATEVRKENCDYISSNFKAIVNSDKILAVERKSLINGVLNKLHLVIAKPTSDQIAKWNQSKDGSGLIKTLRGKLSRIPNLRNGKKLTHETERYIKHFITGQDLLRDLQDDHPVIWEAICAKKRAFEQILEIRSQTSTQGGENRLLEELTCYQQTLEEGFGDHLEDIHINQLLLEAVADWLMRCPLDFPEDLA